jgi:copper chaperone CopZ
MHDSATATGRSWRRIERYAYVDRPYEDVWGWLAGHLSTLGVPLPGDGHQVELRIRPGGREVSRPVRLHVGGLVAGEDRARAALKWADASRPHLFPKLDATLEVVPVPNSGRPCTQLGVLARYRPPFGLLGALGDRLVGAEITDAALTTFLDELAGAVTEHTLAAVPDPTGESPDAAGDDTQLRRIRITVDGLGVRRGGAVEVCQALAELPGVVSVDVDPFAGLATVDHDPAVCSSADLAAALDAAADPGVDSADLEHTFHAGGAVTG